MEVLGISTTVTLSFSDIIFLMCIVGIMPHCCLFQVLKLVCALRLILHHLINDAQQSVSPIIFMGQYF